MHSAFKLGICLVRTGRKKLSVKDTDSSKGKVERCALVTENTETRNHKTLGRSYHLENFICEV